MIKSLDALRLDVRHEAKGGVGDFINRHIMEKDELGRRGRLYALCRLEPGSSVGWHVHTGEQEICHFLSGTGTVREENGETAVRAGDTNIVLPGQGHEVCNTGTEDLVYTALILYSDQA